MNEHVSPGILELMELKEGSSLDILNEMYDFLLADFFGYWCAPCIEMMPVIEKVDRSFHEVKVVKVDVDRHLKLCTEVNILGVPTIIFYHRGKELWRKIGVFSFQQIEEAVRLSLEQIKKRDI